MCSSLFCLEYDVIYKAAQFPWDTGPRLPEGTEGPVGIPGWQCHKLILLWKLLRCWQLSKVSEHNWTLSFRFLSFFFFSSFLHVANEDIQAGACHVVGKWKCT